MNVVENARYMSCEETKKAYYMRGLHRKSHIRCNSCISHIDSCGSNKYKNSNNNNKNNICYFCRKPGHCVHDYILKKTYGKG